MAEEEEDGPPEEEEPGVPGWVVTFSDLMSLLLAFFVLLFSFSELEKSKFKQVGGSLKEAFGVQQEIKVRDPLKGLSFIADEFTAGRPDPTKLNEVRQETTSTFLRYLAAQNSNVGKEEFRRLKEYARELMRALVEQIDTQGESPGQQALGLGRILRDIAEEVEKEEDLAEQRGRPYHGAGQFLQMMVDSMEAKEKEMGKKHDSPLNEMMKSLRGRTGKKMADAKKKKTSEVLKEAADKVKGARAKVLEEGGEGDLGKVKKKIEALEGSSGSLDKQAMKASGGGKTEKENKNKGEKKGGGAKAVAGDLTSEILKDVAKIMKERTKSGDGDAAEQKKIDKAAAAILQEMARGLETIEQEDEDLAPDANELLEELAREIAKRESEEEGLQSSIEEFEQEFQNEIRDGLIEIKTEGLAEEQRVSITIKEENSFPSGTADVLPKFKVVLKKLSDMLGDTKGLITVAGHTDSVPIKTARFRSNWELSTSRAVSVVHALSKEGGIPEPRFRAEGYGENRPVSDNVTDAGRAMNRRVEILLIQENYKSELLSKATKRLNRRRSARKVMTQNEAFSKLKKMDKRELKQVLPMKDNATKNAINPDQSDDSKKFVPFNPFESF